MDVDTSVRVEIAGSIRGRGVIPSIAEVAAALGRDPSDVSRSFERLAQAHVFIPQPGSHEIYAYNPFCVGPTDFRVASGGHVFYAICGWDALGIPAALGSAGRVESSCPDCGDPIVIDVSDDGHARAEGDVVFGVGVPARDFWNDIYFT